MLRKLLARLRRPRTVTVEEARAGQEARYEHETLKTGSFDAPPLLQGQKWPRR